MWRNDACIVIRELGKASSQSVRDDDDDIDIHSFYTNSFLSIAFCLRFVALSATSICCSLSSKSSISLQSHTTLLETITKPPSVSWLNLHMLPHCIPRDQNQGSIIELSKAFDWRKRLKASAALGLLFNLCNWYASFVDVIVDRNLRYGALHASLQDNWRQASNP